MPLTLSGTTGIAGVDGSASTPSVQGSDTNTGEFFPAADTIAWTTGGSERMRVDSSGNVGIGTSSPGRLLSLYATQPVFQITNVASGSASGNGTIQYQVSGSTDFVLDNQGSGSGGVIRWMQAGSERMRIGSDGRVGIGTTSPTVDAKTTIYNSLSGNFVLNLVNASATGYGLSVGTDSNNVAYFYSNSARTINAGTITVSGTTTSYNTSSDYRLKENVQPMTTGLAKISALKPITYDWISDKSEGEGFIAHELQAIIPAAVTGEKDAVNADGDPEYQGVDYSKIVVHLVAAIKELKAELDALKGTVDAQAAEIAALKANAPA